MVRGLLGHSHHEIICLQFLEKWDQQSLAFWRADFDLLRSLAHKVSWEAVLKEKEIPEGRMCFMREILKVQEQAAATYHKFWR